MKFKKSEFFNGNYENSFNEFLQLVDEELNVIEFPSIRYKESNPRIDPLIISGSNSRLKTPNRIAEEIAAILNNFEMWQRNRSSIIIWLFSVDNIKLYNVILTLKQDNLTPRIYKSGGENKYNGGPCWFWTYSFYYDFTC